MKDQTITVCDNCLQASCWQGIFMCDNSRYAGTVEKTLAELEALNLENSDYWNKNIVAEFFNRKRLKKA